MPGCLSASIMLPFLHPYGLFRVRIPSYRIRMVTHQTCAVFTGETLNWCLIDPGTVTVLRAHRNTQDRRFRAEGITSQGWVFTGGDGGPLSPDALTRAFCALRDSTALPPVRLHDLRHGAATFAEGRR
jgi:integrase